ncbi:MAG: hypothetical protein ACKV2T_41190 [Kofleriaceae bacterium]
MQRWILLLAVLAPIAGVGCKTTECAEGTIERNGSCEPAEVVVSPGECGAFTVLQGTQCVPQFPPTECDPSTTQPEVDPATGVTSCVGIAGGGGCTAPLPCPAPTAGKQTLCGRMYNFEDGELFQAANATGARCTFSPPAADGPCSVGMRAYDAIAFASNPQGAMPRPTADFYMDDCGRFRLTDIDNPGSPFLGLAIDDANPANAGPGGSTNIVGIATSITTNGTAINNLEGYVVPVSTTTKWQTTGGPSLTDGYYAAIYRQRRTGFLTQAGVTALKLPGMVPTPLPNNDFYFRATDVTRENVDVALNGTGANGTVLITAASLADTAYTGTGGLPPECRFVPAPGVTISGVVFISIFRPTDAPGMTCPR